MKKLFYILSIALLGAIACSKTEIGELESANENDKVTFVMGIEFPEVFVATRGAMDTDPIIDNIYVAVFGGNGYINDYVKAVPCDASGNIKTDYSGIQNGVLFYYKVSLTATTGGRTIHVIANGPEKIDYGTYDYEVMPNLTTDAGNGAYWTMFSLPNGTAYMDAQTGKYESRPDAIAAFSKLKLIRNFAKITVTSSANNFVFEGFKVFNTPNKGRIVTWKEGYNSSNARLSGFYTPYVGAKDDPLTEEDESTSPMSFVALQSAGYTPSLAEGAAIDLTEPTVSMDYTTASQFVFEREKTPGANRPYIIVKGRYNGGTSTYYRLDFMDVDGNYIPIFRNFVYNINIGNVPKAGATSPSADMQPSNANVSALISTSNLTDLADGKSRILVQYLDKTFITSGAVKFQYLYLRDATATISASSVTPAKFKILSNDELESLQKPLNTADPAFTVNYPTDGTSNWGTSYNSTDEWQEVVLNIAAIGENEKRTTFQITGETTQGEKLFRYVTIHVLAMQNFSATSTTAGSNVGSKVTVNVTLPPNLPSSVFPLEISFEDSAKRLNPYSTDMPAHVGSSIVTGNTQRSYQFVKSVSYADYTTSNVIACEFKRIATGATTLYMENEYFNKPYSISIRAN